MTSLQKRKSAVLGKSGETLVIFLDRHPALFLTVELGDIIVSQECSCFSEVKIKGLPGGFPVVVEKEQPCGLTFAL